MVENRKINPWAWQDAFAFSQAIETSGHKRVLRCAGQTSMNANGEPVHAGDLKAQTAAAFDNLEAVLKAADMTLANVVRLTIYTTDVDGFLAQYEPAAQRLVEAGIQPAMTLLGISRLAFPDLMVEIEADAVA